MWCVFMGLLWWLRRNVCCCCWLCLMVSCISGLRCFWMMCVVYCLMCLCLVSWLSVLLWCWKMLCVVCWWLFVLSVKLVLFMLIYILRNLWFCVIRWMMWCWNLLCECDCGYVFCVFIFVCYVGIGWCGVCGRCVFVCFWKSLFWYFVSVYCSFL